MWKWEGKVPFSLFLARERLFIPYETFWQAGLYICGLQIRLVIVHISVLSSNVLLCNQPQQGLIAKSEGHKVWAQKNLRGTKYVRMAGGVVHRELRPLA